MDEKSRLRTLLKEKAVLRGRFVLASGRKSDYYIDCRRVTLDAEGAELVGAVVLEEAIRCGAGALAGLTMGADPMIVAAGMTARARGYPLKMAIVRKERKTHGTRGQVEGPPLLKKDRVLVVEDVTTTGTSALTAAEAVMREFGCRVAGVFALVDRGEGAAGKLKRHGIAFRAFAAVSELLE